MINKVEETACRLSTDQMWFRCLEFDADRQILDFVASFDEGKESTCTAEEHPQGLSVMNMMKNIS